MLLRKKADGVDISLSEKHYSDFLDFCLKCLAAFQSFKLQRKEEPENVMIQREKCLGIIRNLSALTE